jgi:coenzyme F420-reducing hydrogenase alpha subunit
MKKQLFEYVVLLHTTDEKGKVTNSEIIVPKKEMLAVSDKEVAFKATREIDDKYVTNPENIEIIVRPF